MDLQKRKSRVNIRTAGQTSSSDESTGPSQRKYPKRGLSDTMHGDIYQVKLLMWVFMCGLKLGYRFELATEWPDAEKLDDVVLMHDEEILLMQAKHKQEESKRIKLSDLLNETDGNFSLKKYFISYLNIKRNVEKFKKYKQKKLVLCTNIDFSDHFQLRNFNRVEDDELLNAVLSFNLPEDSNKQPKLLKLNLDEFVERDKLMSALKNTSEHKILAQRLAECLCQEKKQKNRKLDLHDELLKKYQFALAEYVIDVERGSFREEFRSATDKKVAEFREELVQAYTKLLPDQTEFNLNEFYKMKIEMSTSFGKLKPTNVGNVFTELPCDEISDDQIKDFFSKLVFAVNQPNEVELTRIIKKKLKNDFILDDELAFSQFMNEMIDWLKTKEGTFLTEKDCRWFRKFDMKLKLMVRIGQTDEMRREVEKLTKFKISFVDDLSNLLKTFGKQVLIYNFIDSLTTLSKLKILQILRNYEKENYHVNNSYIFVSNFWLDGAVLKAFKYSNETHLMVVQLEELNLLDYLFNKLLQKKIFVNKKKKLIFITQNFTADKLSKQIRDKIELKDTKTNLLDLTIDSQEKFLENVWIKFQGRRLKLKMLFENLNKKSKRNLKKAVDAEMIEKIINDKKLEIGNEIVLWETENYYIKRSFQQFLNQEKGIQSTNKYSFNKDNFEEDNSEDDNSEEDNSDEEDKRIIDQTVNEEEMVNNDKAFVLIAAAPGMGKSTVLTRLAMRMKEKDPGLWVFVVDLKQHSAKFNEEKQLIESGLLKNKDQDEQIDLKTMNIFKVILNIKSVFEQSLFENRWHSKTKLAVLFDGFDEISPNYKETVIQLLEHVLNNKRFAKVWLTTRPNLKDQLENQFKTISFVLNPFSEDDQIDFLKKILTYLVTKNGDTVQEPKLNKLAKKLLDLVYDSIKQGKMFLSTPLHAKMLAEVYHKKFKKSYNEYFKEKIDLVDLYENYVNGKLEIFKGKQDGSDKQHSIDSNKSHVPIVKRKCTELAFEFLFPDQWEDVMRIKYEDIDLNDEELSRFGIVQKVGDSVSFTHQTVAEYFAALYLIEELEDVRKENRGVDEGAIKSFMCDHLYRNKTEVRKFFDLMLVKKIENDANRQFFVDILNDDQNNIEEFLYSKNIVDIVNITDSEGRNAFHLMSSNEYYFQFIWNFDSIENLKEFINSKDRLLGWSPLNYAETSFNWEAVDLLLEFGADCEGLSEEIVNDRYEGHTLLHIAAHGNVNGGEITSYYDLIKVLVEKNKMDLKATDDWGDIPLHIAATWNQKKMFEYLLRKDPTTAMIRDGEGRTAKDLAIENGHVKILHILRRFQPEDISNVELLHAAVLDSKYLEVKRLIDEGVDVNGNLNGWTPLQKISMLSSFYYEQTKKILQLLIDQGANTQHGSLLHSAVVCGNFDVVKGEIKRLDELGADVNPPNDDGFTPLHFAAQFNHLKVVEYYIEYVPKLKSKKQIDINVRDKKGSTPLHAAAFYGNYEMLYYLIENGADAEATDYWDATVLFYAIEGNYHKTMDSIHQQI